MSDINVPSARLVPEPFRRFADSFLVMPVQTKTKSQTYHATMVVTRAEEWCVEATSPEEAKALLQAGHGHRCSPGEIFSVELDEFGLP